MAGFTIGEALAGRRLDEALAALIPGVSRMRLRTMLDAGEVTVNDADVSSMVCSSTHTSLNSTSWFSSSDTTLNLKRRRNAFGGSVRITTSARSLTAGQLPVTAGP